MDNQTKPSEALENFLDFLRSCQERYGVSKALQTDAEHLTQDLLHELELTEQTEERLVLISQELTAARRERRIAKDEFQCIEPVVRFITENQPLIKNFERLLGEVRKIEKNQTNRLYIPKNKGVMKGG